MGFTGARPQQKPIKSKSPSFTTSGLAGAIAGDDLVGVSFATQWASDLDGLPIKETRLRPVLYEVWLLADTRQLLLELSIPSTRDETVRRNALLESYLLHMRCLADFLSDIRKPDHADLEAKEFVASPAHWKSDAEKQARKFRRKYNRPISKLAVHLTDERQQEPDKDWREYMHTAPQELRELLGLFKKACTTSVPRAVLDALEKLSQSLPNR